MSGDKTTDLMTVTLPSLADGAACELFEDELQGVVENILDPNYSRDALRSITLVVKFKPSPDREDSRVAIAVESSRKLASRLSASGSCYVGVKDGEKVAMQHGQLPLFDKEGEKTGPKGVVDISKLTVGETQTE